MFGSLWDALATMLLGDSFDEMAGFHAELSFRFYGLLCGIGLAVGIAATYVRLCS